MTDKDTQKEQEMLRRIHSLAAELPRHEPGTEAVLRMKAAFFERPRPQRQTEFGPVLDMEELAEFLRVDRAALEPYLDEIPCFELGGKMLFRRKSIEEWIERRENELGMQRLESEVNHILSPRGVKQGEEQW